MFNKIKSTFYKALIVSECAKIYSSKKEDIYDTVSTLNENEKLIVVIKDEGLGEKIYDIIRYLKKKKIQICVGGETCIKVSDYATKDKKIVYFAIETVSGVFPPYSTDDMNPLKCMVKSALGLCNSEYSLSYEKFKEIEEYDSFVEILSCFNKECKDEKATMKTIMKCCHYVLSGTDFDEVYGKFKDNVFLESTDFPYNIKLVFKCYYGFFNEDDYWYREIIKDFMKEIVDTEWMKKEDRYGVFFEKYRNRLIFNVEGWKEKVIFKTQNENYDIIETNIGEVVLWRRDESFFRICENKFEIINNLCLEKITHWVIDFNGTIQGYKKTSISDIDFKKVEEVEILEQSKLFEFINNYYEFLNSSRIIDLSKNSNSTDKKIDIKKIIAYDGDFKFISIENLIEVLKIDMNIIKKQVIKTFFRMYKKIIEKNNEKFSNEKELLNRPEIRYLSPIIARAFTEYYFDRKRKCLEYDELCDEIISFRSKNLNSSDSEILYYEGFVYDPSKIPFCFDYELKNKYNKKFNAGTISSLPDGRRIVIFDKTRKSEDVYKEISSKIKTIQKEIGGLEEEKVKFVNISEIIYSKSIVDGMYKCLGYITTPIKGKQLRMKELLKLNNKDLIYVFHNFFIKFSKSKIPYQIFMDSDFTFYIDVTKSGDLISKNSLENSNYCKTIIRRLIDSKYNINAFVACDFLSEDSLSEVCNNFDRNNTKYCSEHGIYYTGDICPVCKKTKQLKEVIKIEEAQLIFEDNVAKHYTYHGYNIKVYKKENVDIQDMKKRIDKILKLKLIFNEQNEYKQDCFIPTKEAYNQENQFIGYVYDQVIFEKDQNGLECVNLEDTEKLKNLHRLKGVIRLIIQIQDLIKKGKVFSKNPYGNVFISRNHKQQVQIMNIEFIDTDGKSDDTFRWTYEYVVKVIGADIETYGDNSFIKDLLKNPNDIQSYETELNVLLTKIQNEAKKMTRYCCVHKMYYNEKYIFCPKCINIEEEKDTLIEYCSEEDIKKRKEIGRGGEAIVYKYGKENVVKVFKEEEIDYNFKLSVIGKIMTKIKVLEKLNNDSEKIKYVVPKKIIVEKSNGKLLGYVMEKVKGRTISELKDRNALKNNNISKKDIFEILIEVGKGIETLHDNNIIIGDLNGNNILFDNQKRVYFLDFDGMGVDEILPINYTDGYIDPISVKNHTITEKDDWYSFAVHAFSYLTCTHPFNGIYKKYNKILDIPTKMENRISLLGNHGMKPPTIAEDWDWMEEDLKNAFYDIFEGDSRIDIVPLLVNQYNQIYNDNIQINSSFIAKAINPFMEEEVEYVISSNVAICKNKYVIVLAGEHKYIFTKMSSVIDLNKIKEVIITQNEKYAFVIASEQFFVVSTKEETYLSRKDLLPNSKVVVNDNSIYYIEYYDGKYVITMEKWEEDVEPKKISFKMNDEMHKIKCYDVKFNDKFVIIKTGENGNDTIYCNNQKLCNIICKNDNTKYNISYDDATKTWLVINEEYGVIINQNGKFDQFANENNETDVDYISYLNGKIYIPCSEKLLIVNARKEFKCKEMECHKIMMPTSKIYKTTCRGFYVLTDGQCYEVLKG